MLHKYRNLLIYRGFLGNFVTLKKSINQVSREGFSRWQDLLIDLFIMDNKLFTK